MVIEFDRVESWPTRAVDFVERWIHTGKSHGDVRAADNDAFHALFSGASVRAYHCARYLNHELESIRTDGLRVASKSLFDERVQRAPFADSFRAQLLARHAFSRGDGSAKGRTGVTCFAVPRAYLNSRLGSSEHAMGGFLMWWGGEAVFTACDDTEKKLLRVGRPTIVVCCFEVAKWLGYEKYVSLLRLCLSIRQSDSDAASQLHWPEPIAAESIESIWHPGHLEYDALDKLPRG